MKVLKGFLTKADIKLLLDEHDSRRADYVVGRQKTGYKRLHLKSMFDGLNCNRSVHDLVDRALKRLKNSGDAWEADLLWFPTSAYIPLHKDEATMFGLKHHRLNAIVRPPNKGGILTVNGAPVDLGLGDAYTFLPDEEPHGVSSVLEGERLVFTVGCWK